MRYIMLTDYINTETKAEVWNTQEKKLYMSLKCDDAVIQIDEDDLAQIRKLFDLARYTIGG